MKLLILLIFITAIIPQYVKATGNHHNDTVINEYYETYNTYNQYVSNEALAMAAAGIQLSTGTEHLQISASVGRMDSENAGMIAIGQRHCPSCPLIQATLGRANGETGLGLSGSWILK